MKSKEEERPKFILTEFYCGIHKAWHRSDEEQFYKCLKRYDSHFSFKVFQE